MKPLKDTIAVGIIVDALGGELRADRNTQINQLASLENAHPGSISFMADARYASVLAQTQATVVIMTAGNAAAYTGNVIITENPYLYFARLTQWWKKHIRSLQPSPASRIDPTASIHPTAEISDTAVVGAGAVIDAYAQIADGCYVGAQSYIGVNVSIGEQSHIAPNVTILDECKIGKRAVINSGTVIGGDGFGFAPDAQKIWHKIEQLGAVVIGDDVEIGSNTCIDRGAIDDTVIGNGVKLDNLIQIGHNVHIGEHTVMASCTGISGSAHIGKRCIIGGAVGMAGHIQIADDVMIMAATNVTKSITKAGQYSGIIPFDEANAWRKNAALLKQLSTMRDRVRELEKQMNRLTATIQKEESHDES